MLTRASVALVVVCVVLSLLDIFAVLLRLWAKRIRRQPLGKDDIFAILALVRYTPLSWSI